MLYLEFALNQILLVTLHTEGEGINLDNYCDKDKENIDYDDNDKDSKDDNKKWAIHLLILLLVVLAVHLPPLQDTPQQGL